MKRLVAIAALLLAGCVTTQQPELPAPQPTEAADVLMDLWYAEVINDAAILTAVRPAISGPAPALSLYDSATQGLISIGGQPTAVDVKKYQDIIAKNDTKALEAIKAEKLALDKKTDELEKQVTAEREARIRAEAQRDAEARRANKAETVQTLLRVGAGAIAAGIAAFLFGSYVGISRLTAGIVCGVGMAVCVGAPWMVDLVEMKWILLGTGAFLGLDLVLFVAFKTWRYFKPPTTPTDGTPGT